MLYIYIQDSTRWPSGTVPDFAIARSRVRLPPMAAVYQCQVSVPSLWGRLMSTSESWGVNGHTTRCTSPVQVVLQLRLVSSWGLRKRKSAPPCGLLRLGKDFTLLFTYIYTHRQTTHESTDCATHGIVQVKCPILAHSITRRLVEIN